MANKQPTARISVVPSAGPGSGMSASPGHFHKRFLFVGEKSLQMKMLMSLISGKFDKPASIVAFSDLSVDDLNKTPDSLIVLDCHSLHKDNLLHLIELLDLERYPGIVLINTSKDTPLKKLAQWPHVVGIMQNNSDPELVLSGFDQILRGGLWLPRDVMEALILNGSRLNKVKKSRPMPVKLTRRETQILEKLAEGTSNTKIADSLFLSEHTVKTHLYNIYKKVNVSNRTQACNWLKQYQGE